MTEQRERRPTSYKCRECNKLFSRFIGEACSLGCFYKLLLRKLV